MGIFFLPAVNIGCEAVVLQSAFGVSVQNTTNPRFAGAMEVFEGVFIVFFLVCGCFLWGFVGRELACDFVIQVGTVFPAVC